MKRYIEILCVGGQILLSGCITLSKAEIVKGDQDLKNQKPTPQDVWNWTQKSGVTAHNKNIRAANASSSLPVESSDDAIEIDDVKTKEEAKLALTKGYIYQAERYYFAILKEHPHDFDALLGMTAIALHQSEFAYAQEVLDSVLAEIGDGFGASDQLKGTLMLYQAQIQEGIGENKLAQAALINLCKLFPTREDAYLALANNYFNQDLPQLAADVVRRATDELGEHPSFTILEIEARIALGDLLSAELQLNQILTELASGGSLPEKKLDIGIYWRFVRTMISLYRLEEAELMIAAGENFYAPSYDQSVTKGLYLEALGHYDDSEAALLSALQLNQNGIEARIILSRLYSQILARRSDALRLAQEAYFLGRNQAKYLRLSKSYLNKP